MSRLLIGAGAVAALVLGGTTMAQAATPTPSASPSVSASTPAPAVSSVLTITGRTAGTGTNFSGTYRVPQGGALVPGEGRTVDLQRRTSTGWATVEADTADVNGAVVYGTVRSHVVQTWRLVAAVGASDPGAATSAEVEVAQHGRSVSALTFPTAGFRTGDHVAFNGWFTYRSWWVTSGPEMGEQGFTAPLGTRVFLQYLSGRTWRNKTSVLTEDAKDAGVNAYIEVVTKSPTPRVWRLYSPGSGSRTAAVSATLTK